MEFRRVPAERLFRLYFSSRDDPIATRNFHYTL